MGHYKRRLQMKYIEDFITRYPDLQPIQRSIENAYALLERAYENGNKLLVGGNGGSAADAEHIVGELMKTFRKDRPITYDMKQRLKKIDPDRGEQLAACLQSSIRALSVTGHTALTTAVTNDVEPKMGFAQQVFGYGDEGDVFLAISTSGNSENLMLAAVTAKAKGLKIILLTGKDGGTLLPLADVAIVVPEDETYKIQERHLPIYHLLCMELEEKFF